MLALVGSHSKIAAICLALDMYFRSRSGMNIHLLSKRLSGRPDCLQNAYNFLRELIDPGCFVGGLGGRLSRFPLMMLFRRG